MIDLNNIESGGGSDFELIPDSTIVRAIITIKPNAVTMPEFSNTPIFKASQSTSAKWLEVEYTIIGGQFDKRKFWQNIMVDGGKINPESGMPWCKEIGIRTFRDIINSTFGLDPNDTSPEAASRRNINDLNVLDGAEFCVKIAVEKGTNGYADKNKMLVALAVNSKEYIGSGNAPQQPVQTPQTQTQPTNTTMPPWAQK